MTCRRDIKCVAVGDSGTGKTCLLTSYAQNTFSPVSKILGLASSAAALTSQTVLVARSCLAIDIIFRGDGIQDHVMTVFDNLNSTVLVDANAVNLFLWDTAGNYGG